MTWQATWRSCDAVCFDVDSTVSPDEGIDLLGAMSGKGEEIAAMTRAAMGGGVSVEEVFRRRFEVFQPDAALIARTLAAHPPALVPGVRDLIAALHAKGVAVHLVSGGFEQLVLPVAALAGVAAERVHCNAILHDAQGRYAGYTAERPTCRSKGKATAVQQLIDRHGYRRVAMVGDGATDAEAKPPAALFIAFAGVVRREKACAAADHVCTDFAELTALLGAPS